MKATVTANGITKEIEATEEQLKTWGLVEKKTGFKNSNTLGTISRISSDFIFEDVESAAAFQRAMKLWLDLWRFSLENGGMDIKQKDYSRYIYFNVEDEALGTTNSMYPDFGNVPFKTDKIANQAIEKYCEELEWYFTTFLRRWE